MFPSSNNGNGPSSFYSDQQAAHHHIGFDSKLEDAAISFFSIPSPFVLPHELEYADLEAFFQQNPELLFHQQQPLNSNIVPETNVNMVVDSGRSGVSELSKICNKKTHFTTSTQPIMPIRRSSKRDRHSKINTAQGPRDRRMRLSLKVARDFFDLQDKLGFDKPSKTVEWLLIQSKAEIKKLCGDLPPMNCSSSTVIGTKSASSTSECEVVSGIEEPPLKGRIGKTKHSLSVKKERRTTKPSRKSKFHPLARESRDKARARARERTTKKMLNRRHEETKPCEEETNHELHQLGGWSPFEIVEESVTQSYNLNPSMEVLAEVDALSSQEQEQLGTTEAILDDSLVITGKWSSSSIFNHMHINGIAQEHQFTDLQSLFKTWEAAYSNIHGLR